VFQFACKQAPTAPGVAICINIVQHLYDFHKILFAVLSSAINFPLLNNHADWLPICRSLLAGEIYNA